MTPFSPLLMCIALFAVASGLTVLLYALLVRDRRRLLSEIQTSASEHSWSFTVQRGSYNPAAFGIRGETFSGLPWSLKTLETSPDQRSELRLELTFPTLGGEFDLAVLPRDPGFGRARTEPREVEVREIPLGLPDFDAVFKVLVMERQVRSQPLNPAVAGRFLKWPTNTVAPHSMAAWRDPDGCHVEAHLSAMANWATIEYLLTLGEDFCAGLPSPVCF